MDSTRFQANSPAVVYEVFDDEVVVINLDTGCYFSLTGVAAVIWNRFVEGMSAQDVARQLARQYDGEIEPAVLRFVGELREEALVVPAAEPAGSGPAVALEADMGSAGVSRTPFVAPVLNKYSDMQELLLLDPIHDVGEAGWPTRPDPAAH